MLLHRNSAMIPALCLTVLLMACGAPKTLADIKGRTANFTATAHIRCKDLDAMALISQETPASCTVAYTSPEALKGMELTFTGEAVKLEYLGLSRELHPSSLPYTAAAGLAASALNCAVTDGGLELSQESGVFKAGGNLPGGEFVVHIDPTDGAVTKLLVPDAELEIDFINFTYLDL